MDVRWKSFYYSHGSQTARRDALVRCLNFLRASHTSKLAVLFNELISVQFYNFTQGQLYCSNAIMLTVE